MNERTRNFYSATLGELTMQRYSEHVEVGALYHCNMIYVALLRRSLKAPRTVIYNRSTLLKLLYSHYSDLF